MSEKPKGRTRTKGAGGKGPVAEPVASAKPKKKETAAKEAAAKKTAAKKSAAKKNSKYVAGKQEPAKKTNSAKKPGGNGDAKLDPFEIAKQTMKGSVPAIVKTMVRKAKQGSCTHAKTVLEMTGAKHMFDDDAEAQENGEPWAKLVLERLDEAERGEEQESAGDETQENGDGRS